MWNRMTTFIFFTTKVEHIDLDSSLSNLVSRRSSPNSQRSGAAQALQVACEEKLERRTAALLDLMLLVQ